LLAEIGPLVAIIPGYVALFRRRWFAGWKSWPTARSRAVSTFFALSFVPQTIFTLFNVLLLPLLGLGELSLEFLYSVMLGVSFWIVVAALSTARFLFSLILAEILPTKSRITGSPTPCLLTLQLCFSLSFFFEPRLFLSFPPPFLLFPFTLLLLNPPLFFFAPPSRFFFPSFLFSYAFALFFGFSFDAPLALCLFGLLSQSLFFSLFLPPLPFLLRQTWHVRSSTCDLPPSTEGDTLVALACAAHITVLVDVPCRRCDAFVGFLAPAADWACRRLWTAVSCP
jgi:hypothetical protein